MKTSLLIARRLAPLRIARRLAPLRIARRLAPLRIARRLAPLRIARRLAPLLAPLLALSARQGGTIDEGDEPLTGWTRTIIRGPDDGSPPTVSEQWIDADTRQTEGVVDPACAASDGRLWSKNNFTGAELCFSPHQQIASQDACMKIAGRYDQGLTGIP